MAVLTDLNLYTTSEKFYIHPVDAQNELVTIDRVSHEITVEGFQSQISPSATSRLIHGVIGIIRLIAGPYLIVVTAVSKVGTICGQPIWKVKETEILSYSRTTLHLTEEQVQFNTTYLSMIKKVLDTQYFYFCNTYDLTHSLQRLFNAGPEFLASSLFERADPRFVWNRSLLVDFANRPELQKYCLPLMHGFVSTKDISLKGKKFSLILISRRNQLRAGTRYFMRGLDNQGNPANYVETEQIIEFNNFRSSFVQIRGSIPLYWSQMPNIKYKPNPTLDGLQNQQEGFQKHIEHVIQSYGPVIMLNLINHTGQELVMEKAFTDMVRRVNNNMVRYESFDFHHECRKMRWDRLSVLMDRIAREQDEYGYFLLSPERALVSQQEGVFRTNCIDSLDRTNVVQGLLAKRSLETQLQKLGVLPVGERIEDHRDFEFIYRNVWADNADICSVQYSGTGALKTDFTRTGKRTIPGAMRDGANSLIRYYKNNFADGFRQDAIDLFLGNYKVNENEGKSVPCPLFEKKDWKYFVLLVFLLGSIAMFFFSMFFPAEHFSDTLLAMLFWAAILASSLVAIVYNGSAFVDWPKLTKLYDVKPNKSD